MLNAHTQSEREKEIYILHYSEKYLTLKIKYIRLNRD